MFSITETRLALFSLLAAGGSLLTAFTAQYGFELYPCELCIWQRWPYAAITIVALAAWRCPRKRSLLLLIATLLFLGEACLALYHVGVEEGVVESVSGCSAQSSQGVSLEELRAQIFAAPAVSCDQPTAMFLGFSMAAWNALAAAVFSIVMVSGLLIIRAQQKEHTT